MGVNDALILHSSAALYAFLGSSIPILVWLWFWLKEDPHPEPRRILFAAFAGGMLSVPVALAGEILVTESVSALGLLSPNNFPFLLLFLWAGIEEYVKYKAAYWTALSRPGFNEPIDAPIYLITAALGFAALENGIFLFRAFLDNTAFGIITGQLRFLGATLLHVTVSGIIGISIAFSFFHKELRHRNVLGGLFTATLLHALFNFLILKQESENILPIFIGVWVVAIIIIIFFEKIKRLRP